MSLPENRSAHSLAERHRDLVDHHDEEPDDSQENGSAFDEFCWRMCSFHWTFLLLAGSLLGPHGGKLRRRSWICNELRVRQNGAIHLIV